MSGSTVSEHGRVLLEAEVRNLERIPDDHLQEMVEALDDSAWMSWKCIPSIVPGEFDANYPTLFHMEYDVSEGWAGEGRVRFFEATETQAPQSH